MDDGIKELAQLTVDLARKWELTNEEEDELLALVSVAYRAGREDLVARCKIPWPSKELPQ